MKKELLNNIYELMRSNGVMVPDEDILTFDKEILITRECQAMRELEYLPEDNLFKIEKELRVIFDNKNHCKLEKKSFSSIKIELQRKGYFKFMPYIYSGGSDTRYPSLVLRSNRFLHIFKNRYFQISYTENGIGIYESGIIRIENLYSNTKGRYEDYFKNSDYIGMLWYTHLISVGHIIDSFTELMDKNSSILSIFMFKTVGIHTTWEIVRKYIRVYLGSIVQNENKPIYQLSNDRGIMFRISTHDNIVEVETLKNGMPYVLELRIPDIETCTICEENELIDYPKYNEEEWKDIRDTVMELTAYTNKRNNNMRVFTLLAISMCGIHVNNTSEYFFTKSSGYLRSITGRNVITVKNYEDLIKAMEY